jgi:hypothetical protein
MHTRRLATGALVAIAACVAALAATPTPTASAATLTFTPVADTYVAQNLPGSNFGTSGHLWIDASPTRRTFMRFNVSGITAPVLSVRLRMHVDSGSSAGSNSGGTYRLMSNTSWSETGPTWNSQPAINGTTLGTIGAVAPNTWVELNVTGRIPRSSARDRHRHDRADSAGARRCG